MAVSPKQRFRIDWVLVNQLAVGPAPRTQQHLQRLADAGVGALLSLCSHQEAPPPEGLNTRFACERLVLPDHRSGRPPQLEELRHALGLIEQLHQAKGMTELLQRGRSAAAVIRQHEAFADEAGAQPLWW